MSDTRSDWTYMVQTVVTDDGMCQVSVHVVHGQIIVETLHAQHPCESMRDACVVAQVMIDTDRAERDGRKVTSATRLAPPSPVAE